MTSADSSHGGGTNVGFMTKACIKAAEPNRIPRAGHRLRDRNCYGRSTGVRKGGEKEVP